MANYIATSAHYRQNGGSWWSPVDGGLTPTGWNATGANKYDTRFRFDFDAIRTMNLTYYISAASFYYKATTEFGDDTVVTRVTDSAYTTLASGSSGTSSGGNWTSIALSAGMIAELTDATAYYFGTYGTANGTYIEIYGEGVNAPYLAITWVARNTAPTWGSSTITISPTGLGVDGNNYIAALNTVLNWGAATDDITPVASLQYYLEYKIGSGSWLMAMNWSTNILTYTFTFATFSVPRGPTNLVTFRVTARDASSVETTTKITTSKGVYLIESPVMGNGWTASSTITTVNGTVVWNVPTTYNSIIDVTYSVEFYDGYTSTWKASQSPAGSGESLVLTDIYAGALYLGLVNPFKNRYYKSNCKIRVTPKTVSLQGTIVTGTAGVSADFLVDYSAPPVLTSLSLAPATFQFETQNITPTMTPGAQGNAKTAANADVTYYIVYDYYVGTTLVYTKSYSGSPVLWAALSAQANTAYMIPSLIIGSGLNDVSITIKPRIVASTGLSSADITPVGYVVKRYRNPVVNITSFVRDELLCTLNYTIVDTGLGAGGAMGTKVLTEPTGNPITGTITYLTNQITFVTTAASSGIVLLTVTNAPSGGTSPAGLTGTDTQIVSSFLPNARFLAPNPSQLEGGLVIKGNYYRFDVNGVPVILGTDFLPLTGGTITGAIIHNVAAGNNEDILYGTIGTNDQYRIRAGGAADLGYLEIATADGGTEPIYVRQYTGVFAVVARTLTLLDASGNTSIPGTLTIGGASATINGSTIWHAGNLTPANYVAKSGATYIQSTGLSTSWGTTSGVNTGAFNAIMGAASSASWLLSGTSGGIFRAGIQVLDSGGTMRIYLGANYYTLTGTTGSIYHSGNFDPTDPVPSVAKTVIQTGSFTITTTWQTITFPVTFPGAPVVFLTMNTTSTGTYMPKTRTLLAASFDAVLGSGSSGTGVCSWTAIYQV